VGRPIRSVPSLPGALLACAVLIGSVSASLAADAPSTPGAARTVERPVPKRAHGTTHAGHEAARKTVSAAQAQQPRRLDLSLGDLRRFFTPAESQTPLQDIIADDVVIESGRTEGVDVDRRPVPVGLVAPFWALSHPLSAWRAFVPDPNAPAMERPDPVPSFRPN
jgi:hypothetical protein